MVAARDMERCPIPGLSLAASASIAGPTDLAGFSFSIALKGESKSASLYLGYLINSHAKIYDQPLSSILRAPYDIELPNIFDGSGDSESVAAALPANPRDLFKADILNQFDKGDLG